MGPNYKRPVVNTPENFRFAESQGTNSFADLPWWEVFKDPMLQDLVRTALTNNYDLKQAVARVEQSRNLAIAARSAVLPANRLQRRHRARAQRALQRARSHRRRHRQFRPGQPQRVLGD